MKLFGRVRCAGRQGKKVLGPRNPARAFLITFMFVLTGFSPAETIPVTKSEISLPATQVPPVIDGVLDDACWTNAVVADEFTLFKSTERTDAVSVKLIRDKQWLYLASTFSNPTLKEVEFNVTKRDDGVHRDESIEIFLDPGTESKFYYHFTLSANNVQGEQGGRDVAWFIPWRSATRKEADRWTAEVALPLSICAGYGDPTKARINFLYNRIQVGLDVYGAKIGQSREVYVWSPLIQSAHEPQNFGTLHGLEKMPMEAAFLPTLDQAQVEPFVIQGEERTYTVSGLVRNYSSVTGVVELVVEDRPVAMGEPMLVAKTLILDEHGQAPFAVKIPVKNFSARTVSVRLRDAVEGEILADAGKLDMSALTVMAGVTANRNYYTDEQKGLVRCVLGMPEVELADLRLVVRDENGKNVTTLDAPGVRATVVFPISAVEDGIHAYTLALESKAGDLIGEEPFTFRKLAPRPGYEVKVDKFNGSLIRNGEPIFPYGIVVTHWHEEMLKVAADIGFDTVIVRTGTKGRPPIECLEMAKKYNLLVSDWIAEAPLDAPGKSAEEKEALCREFYQGVLPQVSKSIIVGREHGYTLMYYTADEPNLADSDMRMLVAESFYQTVQDLDPYHPVLNIFSHELTDNPLALKIQDVLMFDLYTKPGWGGWYFDPVKLLAKRSAELRAASHEHHKVMMVMPISQGQESARTPLPISTQDQRAQTYTAIIYGAKGIIYFEWSNLWAPAMADTFGGLAREIRALAPALLAPEPDQDVTYQPGGFDPVRMQFPMVHARLFRHPEGGYVLLAVSGDESPVETEFTITGLAQSAKVRRMFGNGSIFQVRAGTFTEEIETYGTRAYRIETADLAEPVRLTLNMRADESRQQPRILLRPEVAEIEKGKNFMPNPVFAKRRKYEKFPDFMRPFMPMLPTLGTPQSGWFLDADHSWNGHPSLCMRWTQPFEKVKWEQGDNKSWDYVQEKTGMDNKSSLACSGVDMICYPPVVAVPTKRVFSFYAKGGKDGDQVRVFIYAFGAGNNFTLTEDWARYQMSGIMKPSQTWLPGKQLLIRPLPGATVWLNGLQMEDGDTATDFTEHTP